MENINAFKAALTAILTALTALWGWFGWLVVAWIALMAIDYATGSAVAWKNGEWDSNVSLEGRWHKVGSFVAVLTAGILDMVLRHLIGNAPITLPFEYNALLCPLVLVWYILTEAGSIVENAGALGAPIPSWLTKAIKVFRDKVDDAAGNDDTDT